jgi:hypothetical protein
VEGALPEDLSNDEILASGDRLLETSRELIAELDRALVRGRPGEAAPTRSEEPDIDLTRSATGRRRAPDRAG